MKPTSTSFLLASLATASLIALGPQEQIKKENFSLHHLGQSLKVAGIPAPEDMMVLTQADTPFTVPHGRVFVLTALGDSTLPTPVEFHVDGILEMVIPNGVQEVPVGLAVRPGSNIDLVTSGTGARAWGYLSHAGAGAGISIAGIPDPRGMIVLHESETLVVPQGKRLVLTALGWLSASAAVDLCVDGVPQVRRTSGFKAIPPGLAVDEGKTVTVQGDGSGSGRAWGYLSP